MDIVQRVRKFPFVFLDVALDEDGIGRFGCGLDLAEIAAIDRRFRMFFS